MKKSLSLAILSLLFTFSLFAQSIQEGVNHLYAERYTSAKATFDKMLAANPNNIEAIYWLGQTHIAAGNAAAARQVYDKAFASNGSAPLIMVGLGHVELTEGKTTEARQRFESAITASRGRKGDDPNVLNAIGRANVETRNGDPAYAIAKLTAASQLAPANAEVYINLGNAYRRAKDGGQAVANYIKAAALNPKSAVPYYRQAKIYETQRNWDVYNENLKKAIAADPTFKPAYEGQYTYNLLYKQDFAAAEEISRKIMPYADNALESKSYQAQALYLQKRYPEAITLAKDIISQAGEDARPSYYRLLAYSLIASGDTTSALPYVDQLFTKTAKQDLVPADYTLKATAYSKDRPGEVLSIYMDAAEEDSSNANKFRILQEARQWAKTTGAKIPEADIMMELYNLNTNRNPAQLHEIGRNYYFGRAYSKADSVFRQYSAAFPDSTYGYQWSARSLGRIDSTMEQGLAIPMYEKLLEVSDRDKVKNKAYGLEAIANLASYYVNVKNDREKGIMYLEKGLEYDPNNESFKANLAQLKKPAKVAPAPKTAVPVKKSSTTTKKSSSANSAKKPAPKKKG